MRTALRSQYLWGIVALVLLLGVNVAKDPSFVEVTLNDGNLYGSLIDILRGAAPVLMIAAGVADWSSSSNCSSASTRGPNGSARSNRIAGGTMRAKVSSPSSFVRPVGRSV